MRKVATAKMAGLICSRMPAHISRGMVRCSRPPMNSTVTTSSNEVAKANSAPEATPGAISGSCTRRKLRQGPAPKLAAARVRLRSKPARVAVTVMTTKGVPRAAWAKMSPKWVCARPMSE